MSRLDDEAQAVAAAPGFGDQRQEASPNFEGSGCAEQAAQVIEGEAYAQAYLDRLQADMAEPTELAVIVAFLSGSMLRGACRVLEKALRGTRHA